jgi:hypothetical protein
MGDMFVQSFRLNNLLLLLFYYYYDYYLFQSSFHSVAVVLTLVTNKNKYI